MIDYNIEFTKGILFVRLFGNLNKNNDKDLKNGIYEIIKEGGIKYLVFNIEELDSLDGTNLFNECERIIKENDGKMLICGNYNDLYIDNFEYVDDELSALKEFSLC